MTAHTKSMIHICNFQKIIRTSLKTMSFNEKSSFDGVSQMKDTSNIFYGTQYTLLYRCNKNNYDDAICTVFY